MLGWCGGFFNGLLADRFDLDVFNAGQKIQDVSSAVKTPERHIYDFVLLDSASKAERNFALALEASAEVVVYARLPRGFSIPTPLGEFNPGWAIAFKPGTLKHCYWVVHVNGSAPTTDRSDIEQAKIQCAHKFFDHMNRCFAPDSVRFAVVDSFPGLMSVVRSDVTAP